MLKSIYFTFAHQNNEHQYFTYSLLYSLTDFMIQSKTDVVTTSSVKLRESGFNKNIFFVFIFIFILD